MGRFLLWAALVAGAWWMLNFVGLVPSGLEISERQVHRETRDLDYGFTRQGSLSEQFMLFGGNHDAHGNSMSDVMLAGLPLRHARLIAQSYPDFHMCASPGAEQAKRHVESLSLIAATRRARATLAEALDLFEERLRGGGERTCVRVEGSLLSLDTVTLRHDGSDLSHEVLPRLQADMRFALAEKAEILDCAPLLH